MVQAQLDEVAIPKIKTSQINSDAGVTVRGFKAIGATAYKEYLRLFGEAPSIRIYDSVYNRWTTIATNAGQMHIYVLGTATTLGNLALTVGADGYVYLNPTGSNAVVTGNTTTTNTAKFQTNNDVAPQVNGGYYLGYDNYRWADIYVNGKGYANDSVSTSSTLGKHQSYVRIFGNPSSDITITLPTTTLSADMSRYAGQEFDIVRMDNYETNVYLVSESSTGTVKGVKTFLLKKNTLIKLSKKYDSYQ